MHNETVHLTEPQLEFLKFAISSGPYKDINEAVQKGLNLLQDNDQEILDARARILKSLEQARRGELIDGKTAVDNAFFWRKERIEKIKLRNELTLKIDS